MCTYYWKMNYLVSIFLNFELQAVWHKTEMSTWSIFDLVASFFYRSLQWSLRSRGLFYFKTVGHVLFWVAKALRIEAILQNSWKKSSNYCNDDLWLFSLKWIFHWKTRNDNNLFMAEARSFQSLIIYKRDWRIPQQWRKIRM